MTPRSLPVSVSTEQNDVIVCVKNVSDYRAVAVLIVRFRHSTPDTGTYAGFCMQSETVSRAWFKIFLGIKIPRLLVKTRTCWLLS